MTDEEVKSRPPNLVTQCSCGKPLYGEDATFWGECSKCRLELPIKTVQCGDFGRCAGAADRQYHGGNFRRAEW